MNRKNREEMKPKIFVFYLVICGLLFTGSSLLHAQKSNTYCNPLNLGYAYEHTWTEEPHESFRSAADPKKVFSKKLVDPFPQPGWDPALFVDDDGRMYFYWGSGNDPRYNYIKGVEVDPHNGFNNKGPAKELFFIYPNEHGWERFGENNMDTLTSPYVEGSWMTKHNGKYYLQYAAPGTEWNVYADGVYVSEHSLGPFTYQPSNPFSYKPGGYIRGAGHGNTMQDKYGNYWHVATMQISVKYKFERRIGLFPAGFDNEGQLYCITAFGDYPQRILPGPADHTGGIFAISDFRVFGMPEGAKPETVRNFTIVRAADTRNLTLAWDAVTAAYAYNIYYGIAPEKLYNCVMVIDQDRLNLRGLNRDVNYYFSIQAIGENGISGLTDVQKVE